MKADDRDKAIHEIRRSSKACTPFVPRGCHVTWTRKGGVKGLEYCDLHAAAPALRAALGILLLEIGERNALPLDSPALLEARAAFLRSERP